MDFDGDEEQEMVVLAPFHGDCLSVYKKFNGEYREVYTHPQRIEFAHGIYAGTVGGEPAAVIGYRKGERNLFALTCKDGNKLEFETAVLDENVGPANIFCYQAGRKEYIVSANREIDEIAFYEVLNEKGE